MAAGDYRFNTLNPHHHTVYKLIQYPPPWPYDNLKNSRYEEKEGGEEEKRNRTEEERNGQRAAVLLRWARIKPEGRLCVVGIQQPIRRDNGDVYE